MIRPNSAPSIHATHRFQHKPVTQAHEKHLSCLGPFETCTDTIISYIKMLWIYHIVRILYYYLIISPRTALREHPDTELLCPHLSTDQVILA